MQYFGDGAPDEMRSRGGKVAISSVGLAALWLLLAYSNALATHAPRADWALAFFWPPVGSFSVRGFLAAQAANGWALAALLLFDLAALGLGLRVLGFVRVRKGAGMAGTAAALVLGTTVAGTACAALAMSGLAFGVVFVGLAVGSGFCLVRARPAGAIREGASALRGLPPVIAAAAGVLALGGLLGALAPEVTDDALRLYLGVPRRALLLHKLAADLFSPFSFVPLAPCGANLPLMALGGDLPAKLLSWQAWLVVAALVHERARDAGAGRWLAGFAAVGWLSLLNVPVLAQTAMPDCSLALAVTTAFLATFGGGKAALAGLLWGCALATKYQAGYFVAGAGMALAFTRPRALAPMAAAALVPVLPWLARNWLEAGTPLAPFWMAWTARGGAEAVPGVNPPAREWFAGRGTSSVLAAPFTLVRRPAYWDSLFPPLVLVLLPAALGLARPRALGAALGISALLWAWQTGNAGRYLLPAFPLVVAEGISGLAGAAGIARRGRAPAVLAAALLAAFVLYEAVLSFGWSFYALNPAGVALGKEPRGRYLERLLIPRPAAWRASLGFAEFAGAGTRYSVTGVLNAYYWPGLPEADVEGLPSRTLRMAMESADTRRLAVKMRQRGWRFLVERGGVPGLPPEISPDNAAAGPRARRLLASFTARRTSVVMGPRSGGAFFTVRKLLPAR